MLIFVLLVLFNDHVNSSFCDFWCIDATNNNFVCSQICGNIVQYKQDIRMLQNIIVGKNDYIRDMESKLWDHYNNFQFKHLQIDYSKPIKEKGIHTNITCDYSIELHNIPTKECNQIQLGLFFFIFGYLISRVLLIIQLYM